MKAKVNIKLRLVLQDNFLIVNTIVAGHSGMKEGKLLDPSKYKGEILNFLEKTYKINPFLYCFLLGEHYYPALFKKENLLSLGEELVNYFEKIKRTPEFKVIKKTTLEHLQEVKKEWERNYPKSSKIISKILRIPLKGTFKAYLTHPGLPAGRYIGENSLIWGRKPEFKNYHTVYLWHEILHSIFSGRPLEHSVLQLITDNELRARLNREKYPPFEGHPELIPLMEKMLPYWKKYLRSRKDNILEFTQRMKDYINHTG